jgi:hypothetical protein
MKNIKKIGQNLSRLKQPPDDRTLQWQLNPFLLFNPGKSKLSESSP